MARYLHPDVINGGPAVLLAATNTVMHICSAQPANLAGIAAVSLGSKTNPTLTGSDITNGRKVTVSAIAGASVTAGGSAAYYAFADATRLLASAEVPSPQTVYSGNTWGLPQFDIETATVLQS